MMNNSKSILVVNNISQAYDKRLVLSDVSFEIGQNQIVTLLGPNGCGKTTLIKTICGLVKSYRGSIHLHPSAQTLSLFQPGSSLYSDLTLQENLDLYATLYGTDDIWKKELVGILDLKNFLNQRTSYLSWGQRIRGSLCRTFLKKTSLYLLDEPLTGLDLHAVSILIDLLTRIRESGNSILIATHHSEKLDGITNRRLKLENSHLSTDP